MKHLFRFFSGLLITALLCTTISSCYASAVPSSEISSDEAISVFVDLLEAFDQNPSEGRWLNDKESVDAYCKKLYSYIDPNKAQHVFYGDSDAVTELLKQLSGSLESDGGSYSDIGLENAELLYVCVWAVMHTEIASSRPAVKEFVIQMFTDYFDYDGEAIITATDLCIDYIVYYDSDVDRGYNMNRKSISISGGEEFYRFYQEGYELFEKGKYSDAITAYKKALEYNTNDVTASLEIVEAYIALRDYANAKVWLNRTYPYLSNDMYKAHWLRRWGFIAIEELDYELASACYVYSQEFEQSSNAETELMFIKQIAPATKDFSREEAVEYLKEKGIFLSN